LAVESKEEKEAISEAERRLAPGLTQEEWLGKDRRLYVVYR
jgi:hypothetical protein